jgi:hypothetical protein
MDVVRTLSARMQSAEVCPQALTQRGQRRPARLMVSIVRVRKRYPCACPKAVVNESMFGIHEHAERINPSSRGDGFDLIHE